MHRLLLSLVLVALLGCEPAAKDAAEPVWGKQPCEHCAMLLSERDHGAQLVTADGERLYFDDLGCMIAWTREHPGVSQRQWVRTADTQEWIAPQNAGFEPTERTPMGFGVIAVSKPGSLTWSDANRIVQQRLKRE
jgi:copper chaperone NosL